MAFKGKKYREKAKLIDRLKLYDVVEAVKLVKETSTANFDAAVELHVKCDLDVKHADQMVREMVTLPHGIGKDKLVAAFVSEDKIKESKNAGADFVGGEDLIDEVIKKEWTGFDVAVATPDMMRVLAKAGKILGTKGLMPSPKTGTVTPNPAAVIKELKAGKMEFKADEGAVIHMTVGRISFSEDQLKDNVSVAMDAIKHAKPSGARGTYIRNAYLATTMGPSIPLSLK